ncbi:hypothetical protein U1872_21640 [Sphingomonas sp. RB3P16]|uniref:hypothetical protein n=1 Tax=Parasphingomonas frigoris TaxID=3096163 RepID=UPI002FCCAD26
MQTCQAPGKLDQNRSHPARTVDDEQRAPAGEAAEGHVHPVEQQLECSQRRQRQCRRRGPVERGRLGADDAFVDEVKLGIAARPVDRTGIEHRVSGCE